MPDLSPHRRINRTLAAGGWLHRHGWARTARLVDLLNRVVFSADIPCRIPLPPEVTFMHNGLGTVIDEHVVFTGPAVIFHGVTLGHAHNRGGGVPTIGRDVVIGAGAGVFGSVRVGDRCRVGANVVLTSDLPDDHRVRLPAVEPVASAGARIGRDAHGGVDVGERGAAGQ